MSKTAKFATIKLQPYPNRTEHVNIGLVFWRGEKVRLHLAADLHKLTAFYPQADIKSLREWELGLAEFFIKIGIDTLEEQHKYLKHFGEIRASEQLGHISFNDERQYAEKVQMMMHSLVTPARKTREIKDQTSNLSKDLKTVFRGHGWLGKSPTDISKHLIVPNYTLSPDIDAKADFAMLNGKLNIIETIDLRTTYNAQKRTQAQSKALMFDLANSIQGESIAGYAVLAGAIKNDDAKSTINLMKRYADHTLMWEDQSDMTFFLNEMSKKTQRPMLELPIS